MRISALVAGLATLVSMSIAQPTVAEATHWERHHRGWGHARTVRHRVYYPRYRHVYYGHRYTDPYAYRYQPRGYYPYYNSGYWGPPMIKRHRAHMPPYYRSWGAPRRHYRHRAWHHRMYGRHRHGHW
jgi:hypothetical protein